MKALKLYVSAKCRLASSCIMKTTLIPILFTILFCGCFSQSKRDVVVDQGPVYTDTVPLKLDSLIVDTILLDQDRYIFALPTGFVKKHELTVESNYYLYYYINKPQGTMGSLFIVGRKYCGLVNFHPWDTLQYAQINSKNGILSCKVRNEKGVFRCDEGEKGFFAYYGYIPPTCEVVFDSLLESLALPL